MEALAINIKRFAQNQLRDDRQADPFSSTGFLASIFMLFFRIFSIRREIFDH